MRVKPVHDVAAAQHRIAGASVRMSSSPLSMASMAAYWAVVGAHMMANWWSLMMLLHHRRGAAGIAQPPAGHGKGLGKAVDQDGPLLHSRQGGDAHMRLSAVGQLPVDFIATAP